MILKSSHVYVTVRAVDRENIFRESKRRMLVFMQHYETKVYLKPWIHIRTKNLNYCNSGFHQNRENLFDRWIQEMDIAMPTSQIYCFYIALIGHRLSANNYVRRIQV